jgi:hypothetical protein
MFRVLGGGGPNTIAPFPTPDLGAPLTGVVPFEFLGSEPAKQSSAKTPFRPDVPCETQAAPDLNAGLPGPAPSTSSASADSSSASFYGPELQQLRVRYADVLSQLEEGQQLKSADPAAGKQLIQQAIDQYAAFVRDLNAYGRSSGQNLPHLSMPSGVKG